jgi:toxin ParE1/3/4
VKGRYIVRPRADRDIDRQAVYLAEQASPEIAYRFLTAVRATFVLLAFHPEIGWRPPIKIKKGIEPFRMFSVSGFDKMLVLYRPTADRVEILRVLHGARDIDAVIRKRQVE